MSMPGLASNYLLSKLNASDFNAESPAILAIFKKWPYETFRRCAASSVLSVPCWRHTCDKPAGWFIWVQAV